MRRGSAPEAHPVFPEVADGVGDPRAVDAAVAMVALLVREGVGAAHAASAESHPLKVVGVDQPQRQRLVLDLCRVEHNASLPWESTTLLGICSIQISLWAKKEHRLRYLPVEHEAHRCDCLCRQEEGDCKEIGINLLAINVAPRKASDSFVLINDSKQPSHRFAESIFPDLALLKR